MLFEHFFVYFLSLLDFCSICPLFPLLNYLHTLGLERLPSARAVDHHQGVVRQLRRTAARLLSSAVGTEHLALNSFGVDYLATHVNRVWGFLLFKAFVSLVFLDFFIL